MVFWERTLATPSFADSLNLWTSTPRFLRTVVPERPTEGRPIRRAMAYDGPKICEFWRLYYGGDDWILDATLDWVRMYIDDPDVYVLIMTDTLHGILATIVSTPITQERTLMSHGAVLTNVRCIEGLCIHPSQRGKGLAGTMIASMDWYTANMGATVHLWSRELAVRPFMFHTALEISTYTYIDCIKARCLVLVEPMLWEHFVSVWKDRAAVCTTATPSIVTTLPLRRRGDLFAWKHGEKMAVIVRTRRLTKVGLRRIYEIAWCNLREGDGSFAPFLESVAAMYDGVLFASSARTGGGAVAAWGDPWVFGHSGYHAWYIYNYMPPTFGSCELHIVREEI